ncbi:SIS domain-containing protein [Methanocaldococcus indicus]|uniref:SIS domain-containing protein n=1 Tax=Methanocaldococcus indicus TaxID=213231 RepID=UPI003C6CDCC1
MFILELDIILKNIKNLKKILDSKETDIFINKILSSKRIFIFGIGRSGYVGRCFFMRLMHLNFNVYFVSEAPAFKEDDLLIVISNTGKCVTIKTIIEKAKKISNNIVVITSKNSKIKDISFSIVLDVDKNNYLPMGTTFEHTALIYLDLVIAKIMKVLNKSEEDIIKEHNNLL